VRLCRLLLLLQLPLLRLQPLLPRQSLLLLPVLLPRQSLLLLLLLQGLPVPPHPEQSAPVPTLAPRMMDAKGPVLMVARLFWPAEMTSTETSTPACYRTVSMTATTPVQPTPNVLLFLTQAASPQATATLSTTTVASARTPM
jgi:hypothetical protein